MNTQMVPWMAGLFEGEGCFTMDNTAERMYPRAQLSMTDEDVVRKFHAAAGFGTVHVVPPRGARRKTQWRWEGTGVERCQALGAAMWAHLGARRRARFAEVMWNARLKPPTARTWQ